MKKKFTTLAVWSFVLAVCIFVLTYLIYHFVAPDGSISLVYQEEPGKPFVAGLFGIWGVLFLFSGVMNLLIARIFFTDTSKNM